MLPNATSATSVSLQRLTAEVMRGQLASEPVASTATGTLGRAERRGRGHARNRGASDAGGRPLSGSCFHTHTLYREDASTPPHPPNMQADCAPLNYPPPPSVCPKAPRRPRTARPPRTRNSMPRPPRLFPALLLVSAQIVVAKTKKGGCTSHESCMNGLPEGAPGMWCDDLHACRACNVWNPSDPTASITHKNPTTCGEAVPPPPPPPRPPYPPLTPMTGEPSTRLPSPLESVADEESDEHAGAAGEMGASSSGTAAQRVADAESDDNDACCECPAASPFNCCRAKRRSLLHPRQHQSHATAMISPQARRVACHIHSLHGNYRSGPRRIDCKV